MCVCVRVRTHACVLAYACAYVFVLCLYGLLTSAKVIKILSISILHFKQHLLYMDLLFSLLLDQPESGTDLSTDLGNGETCKTIT